MSSHDVANGPGPTIYLNDAPLRPSHEFERLSNEEAGLMDDEEAFYYDRNYDQSRQIFGPLQDAWSSLKRQTGLAGALHKRSLSFEATTVRSRRGWRRVGLVVLIILALLGVVQLFTIGNSAYVALFPAHMNRVITSWAQIGKPDSPLEHWPTDLTRGVLPVACHSHNDYWRAVPLYSGLSAGCISTEADVWLTRDGELLVGHDESSLTRNRTLSSLYIEPLLDILTRQNPSTEFVPDGKNGFHGVFDTEPERVLTLLIDFKTGDKGTFEAVVRALEPLREKGYLTHVDGRDLVERPIRVVGSGNVRYESVVSPHNKYQDIFLDAPIEEMESPLDADSDNEDEDEFSPRSPPSSSTSPSNKGPNYTPETSYYASGSFADNIGTPWGWSLSNSQLRRLRAQIRGAHARGLKARYWETPVWPVSRRNAVWDVLVREGADVLSVDDLEGAVREDWRREGRWWGRD